MKPICVVGGGGYVGLGYAVALATSMRDMGKVMKAAMAALAGKTVDGKKVSEAVKAKLG